MDDADYCEMNAAYAMWGLLARTSFSDAIDGKDIARKAFEIADAMVEERKARGISQGRDIDSKELERLILGPSSAA